MSLSVVIPACNEERYLPATLEAIDAARAAAAMPVEVIVVDNGSTDATADVAARAGAVVVREPLRNVARARNRGAAAAAGEWLVFVDADTIVPPSLFARIAAVAGECIGGAANVRHSSNRLLVRLWLHGWRILGTLAGLAQGATQFCRREAFAAVGGYDESLWMGEDVDFYARLRRRGRVCFLRDVWVTPSPRRFDRWPVWKILWLTNPVVILLARRRRRAWRGWYDELVR